MYWVYRDVMYIEGPTSEKKKEEKKKRNKKGNKENGYGP